MRAAAVALFALTAAGCGRVGAPQPPYIRIPEAVRDFSASQNGYDIVLAWTNPAHNIDGSAADNLYEAEITSAAGSIATLAVTGMGKPQSYVIPAKDWVGVKRTFTLKIDTNRDKVSAPATVSLIPVDVPGAISNLHFGVDQRTITLEWEPPLNGAAPADGYLVQRTDGTQPPQFVTDQSFKDKEFEAGKTYTYVVTAARRSGSAWIPGVGSQQIKVEAVDRTPPKAPAGLHIVVSDGGAFVAWDANEETDLDGYFLFRSDGPNAAFHPVGPAAPMQSNSYFDPAYRAGFRYQVSAVDDSKNESPRSAIVER